MKTVIFQVDAFSDKSFGGNPAAVCPLDDWLSDETMQSIAMENNLSETAFFRPADGTTANYDLRWFTPTREVDLCGHATMASAHVLFHHLACEHKALRFDTRSGILTVSRGESVYEMDLPSWAPTPVEHSAAAIGNLFGDHLVSVLQHDPPRGMNLAILSSEDAVRAWEPDDDAIAALAGDGLIVSAQSENPQLDFVSRYFAPASGIPEDPVTGSAHCVLAPYWGPRLSKTELRARQVSARGGAVNCALRGDRVVVAGAAVTYLIGEIHLEG